MTGTKTTNLDALTALSDEILVNRNGSTALQKTSDLSAQMAASGPIANSIQGAAIGLIRATSVAGLGAGSRVGQPGQVTAGTGKGEYTWTGSAWSRTGDLIDATVVSETAAAVEDLQATKLDATLNAFRDLIGGADVKADLVAADSIIIRDSEDSLAAKRVSLTSLLTLFRSFYDSLYASKTIATDRLLGRDAAGTGDVEAISLTNGLGFTGSNQIGLADMPEATFKGRVAGAGTGTPTNMTATQARAALAISNVDNTSDLGKPVSTAQQTALDTKLNATLAAVTNLTSTADVKAEPVGGDGLILRDSQNDFTIRRVTLTAIRDLFRAFYDGLYASKTIATDRLLGRDAAGTGDVEAISLTNGLGFTGSNQIGLADMPEATFKGRVAGAGTGTPTNMTVTQARAALAISNVDNTSDLGKPVSTAQQTALDAKLNDSTATNRILGRKTTGTGAVEQLAPVRGVSIDADGLGLADMPEATFKGRVAGAGTGTPTNMTAIQAKVALLLDLVDNTTDMAKPVSTAQQAALDTKTDKTTVDQIADDFDGHRVQSSDGRDIARLGSDGSVLTRFLQIDNDPDQPGINVKLGDGPLARTFFRVDEHGVFVHGYLLQSEHDILAGVVGTKADRTTVDKIADDFDGHRVQSSDGRDIFRLGNDGSVLSRFLQINDDAERPCFDVRLGEGALSRSLMRVDESGLFLHGYVATEEMDERLEALAGITNYPPMVTVVATQSIDIYIKRGSPLLPTYVKWRIVYYAQSATQTAVWHTAGAWEAERQPDGSFLDIRRFIRTGEVENAIRIVRETTVWTGGSEHLYERLVAGSLRLMIDGVDTDMAPGTYFGNDVSLFMATDLLDPQNGLAAWVRLFKRLQFTPDRFLDLSIYAEVSTTGLTLHPAYAGMVPIERTANADGVTQITHSAQRSPQWQVEDVSTEGADLIDQSTGVMIWGDRYSVETTVLRGWTHPTRQRRIKRDAPQYNKDYPSFFGDGANLPGNPAAYVTTAGDRWDWAININPKIKETA